MQVLSKSKAHPDFPEVEPVLLGAEGESRTGWETLQEYLRAILPSQGCLSTPRPGLPPASTWYSDRAILSSLFSFLPSSLSLFFPSLPSFHLPSHLPPSSPPSLLSFLPSLPPPLPPSLLSFLPSFLPLSLFLSFSHCSMSIQQSPWWRDPWWRMECNLRPQKGVFHHLLCL